MFQFLKSYFYLHKEKVTFKLSLLILIVFLKYITDSKFCIFFNTTIYKSNAKIFR